MKSLLAKTTSTAAGAIVILVGCAMAGLGLTVIAVVALFALAAFGLALLARPFVAWAKPNGADLENVSYRENQTAG